MSHSTKTFDVGVVVNDTGRKVVGLCAERKALMAASHLCLKRGKVLKDS